MLTKWHKNKPSKLQGDYYSLPSRFDLISLLGGMYNACWDYQQVADAVTKVYADENALKRSELVTASLIAHRRKRMVAGTDGINFSAIAKRLVQEIEVRNLENKGTHYEHAYNADERRFTPVW